MSAKPSKKRANPSASAATPQPVAATAGAGGAASLAATEPAVAPSWIDSADPKKRMWGKIILVAVWIYVAALWLLALDQTFNWGIFGPKVPPIP
jgi:hypothetical protein